ncbi:MAG: hypothetical protein KDA77_04195, partial [Planctomycetaceae bacterium]|nr:hypothetical protein [Planctomycetaceae bacterium]
LFLVGEKDQSVIPRMTELILQKIRHSKTRVCQLPQAIHNAGRFTHPERYDAALIDFFSQMPMQNPQEQAAYTERHMTNQPGSESRSGKGHQPGITSTMRKRSA